VIPQKLPEDDPAPNVIRPNRDQLLAPVEPSEPVAVESD
jgi:hypothetical protein